MKPLDEQFIRRVYRTTAWVVVVLAVMFWVCWGSGTAGGVVAGCALMTVCLWLTEIGVRRYVRPGVRDLKPLFLYAAVIYPLVIAAVWILTSVRSINMAAVMVGIALPILVIVLKVVGRNLIARVETHSDPPVPSGGSGKE